MNMLSLQQNQTPQKGIQVASHYPQTTYQPSQGQQTYKYESYQSPSTQYTQQQSNYVNSYQTSQPVEVKKHHVKVDHHHDTYKQPQNNTYYQPSNNTNTYTTHNQNKYVPTSYQTSNYEQQKQYTQNNTENTYSNGHGISLAKKEYSSPSTQYTNHYVNNQTPVKTIDLEPVKHQQQTQQVQQNQQKYESPSYNTNKIINSSIRTSINNKNYVIPSTQIDLSEKKKHSKHNVDRNNSTQQQQYKQYLPDYSSYANKQSPQSTYVKQQANNNLKASIPSHSYVPQSQQQNYSKVTEKRYIIDANGNRQEYTSPANTKYEEKKDIDLRNSQDIKEQINNNNNYKIPVFTTHDSKKDYQQRQTPSYVPSQQNDYQNQQREISSYQPVSKYTPVYQNENKYTPSQQNDNKLVISYTSQQNQNNKQDEYVEKVKHAHKHVNNTNNTVQQEVKTYQPVSYDKKIESNYNNYEKKYEPIAPLKKYEPSVPVTKYEPSQPVTKYENITPIQKYEPVTQQANTYEKVYDPITKEYTYKKKEETKAQYITYEQKYQPKNQYTDVSFKKQDQPTVVQEVNTNLSPAVVVNQPKEQSNVVQSPIIHKLQESMDEMHQKQERNQGQGIRKQGRQRTRRMTKKLPRTPMYLKEGQTPSSCYRGSPNSNATPFGKAKRLNISKFSSQFKPQPKDYEVVLGNKYGFNKQDILGQGAFGTVYEGINLQTEEKVAIKSMDNALFKSVQEKEALKAEIEVMKTLESTNVVQMYDVYDINNFTYLILEICPDGDLEEYLRLEGGRIEEDQAVQILFQILQGFKDLISHGYIHRDIKPANTLIKGKYYKLADFGLSTKCDLRDKMNEFVGSPLYMAPQLLEAKPYTIKSDIWSIGLMFYEMLFGKTPWPARDLESLKYNIKNMPLRFPYDVPIGQYTKSFIQGCLQKEEADRLDWKELFQHPIFFHTGDKSHQDVFDDRSKEIIREIQESVQIEHIDMHTLFDRYDTHHQGNLNIEEFYNLLHNIDNRVTHQEAEHIFQLMHSKNSTNMQLINYKEFKKIFTEYDFVDLDDHANNLLNDLREIIKHNKIDIYQIFNEFDFNKKGDLKPAQFYQLIKRLAPGLCDDDIDILYESFDDDQDGQISYEEFYSHLSYGVQHLNNDYNPYTEKAKKIINELCEIIAQKRMSVEDVFNKFDGDKNGKLDLVEFQLFVNDISPKTPLRDIQAVYHYLDEDDKGFIKFHQLKNLMN